MNEKQQKEALLIMRFELSEIENFEDMVYGRGSPSTYTEGDVKMYIRGLKDNISGFFRRNNIPTKED